MLHQDGRISTEFKLVRERTMEKIIELKNLTKNFDDQQVLKGINLDIHHNEFLTLLGPSGCGKTGVKCFLTAWIFPKFLLINVKLIPFSRSMHYFRI